ncbi:MAG: class I SAM-dependent methyltransferase [Thermoplasmata archaeon]
MQEFPYYGTYHHTTPEQSEIIRAAIKEVFNDVFLHIGKQTSIENILDAGCGLGFLCEQAAKFFPKSSVIGVDLFGSKSLLEGDLKIAEKNMQIAGLDQRVKFLKADLTDLEVPEKYFDLVISNLVFHNLGKARYDVYPTIGEVLKPGGFFVIGDFFTAKDKKILAETFSLQEDRKNVNQMPPLFSIMLLKN